MFFPLLFMNGVCEIFEFNNGLLLCVVECYENLFFDKSSHEVMSA